jgi:hypothetical protein
MWAAFTSRFDIILKNLAYHSTLVDKEAVAADISNAVMRNEEDARKWEQQEQEWAATKIRAVLSWLETNDPLQEDVLERHVRECLPGSCDWFIQHKETRLWLGEHAQNALIWLHGKPGAGRSSHLVLVVCANYRL